MLGALRRGRRKVEELAQQFALTERDAIPARQLRRERVEGLLLELLERTRHERLSGLRALGNELPVRHLGKEPSGFFGVPGVARKARLLIRDGKSKSNSRK